MGGRKRMTFKWVWRMKLNRKGWLLSKVMRSRKDAEPGMEMGNKASNASTSSAVLLWAVGGVEFVATGVEFPATVVEFMATVVMFVAIEQSTLGSHGSAQGEFRNIYIYTVMMRFLSWILSLCVGATSETMALESVLEVPTATN